MWPDRPAGILPRSSAIFAVVFARAALFRPSRDAYYHPVISLRVLSLALVLLSPTVVRTQAPAAATTASAEQQPIGVLTEALTEKLLPATVLYKGQQAPVQARNSGAVRFPDGSLVITSMVDSSGYSTGVRERYQFFLYTERALRFGEKTLPPGFYGGGFLQDNTLLVTDVSGHDVLSTATTTDAGFKRPRPLQILSAPDGGFRLYLGRAFVTLVPAS